MSSPSILADLAPTGVIRAAINFGNPVLAQRGPGGEAGGVSVALARELGRRLGVEVTIVPFEGAGKVTDVARDGVWDLAFLAVDPVRAQDIAFTAPYVVIEGIYVVRDASPVRVVADVDRDGTRISVGRGSAYDLYLTRSLKKAELVRTASTDAIAAFEREGLDVLAGVGQPLRAFVAATPGMRVIPGRFMAIEQAMALPRGREAGLDYLRGFIEEAKASGFVAKALQESGQPDAQVAPPA
jgi:polar amino acid transport system substrate-binding protein